MEIFKNLFDFKFDSLISPKVIRLVYAVVSIVTSAFIVILTLISIEDSNGLSIIFVPIIGAIYLGVLRIVFESAIVRFQMAQDIREIKNKYLS